MPLLAETPPRDASVLHQCLSLWDRHCGCYDRSDMTAEFATRMRWGEAPELIGPRHAYRVRRLARLFQQAVPGGHVLDAGCGAGRLTELLAQRGYRVTAVEASPEFVDYVRERVARAGLASRVEVRLGDLERAG